MIQNLRDENRVCLNLIGFKQLTLNPFKLFLKRIMTNLDTENISFESN